MSSQDPGGALAALGWTPRLDAAFAALGRPDLIPRASPPCTAAGWSCSPPPARWPASRPGGWRTRPPPPPTCPAVGDWVAADPESGVVHALLPRKGGIARAAGDGRTEPQVLAANVDLALVVGSLNRDLNVRRLERFLTLAADAEAEALVVLSKADLSDDPAGQALDVRAALGGSVPVLAISVVDGTGMEALGGLARARAHGGAARLLGRRQDHAAQPPDRRASARRCRCARATTAAATRPATASSCRSRAARS